jgi:hypothetical protein
MRHHNSVLHGVLKHVPWAVFDRLVGQHRADHRVRRLSTRSQLVAMLYAQIAGAASLREIEAALESHAARLYHLGARPVSRSTLADANARRPHGVFSELFAYMAGAAGRGLRRAGGDLVRVIDATSLRLSGLAAGWAGGGGAKAHVIYDPDADRPLYLAVTPARVNDITPARAMPIEPGATYVFDLGYYSFAWWAALDARGCRWVTRLKRNTPLAVTVESPVPGGGALAYDRIGLLPARLSGMRANPFAAPVREIGVALDDGRVLRVVTNDLDAPADEIAALYRRRWAVELFFRWVKQTLKIRHFVGRSENAVRLQVAVALIAYMLLRLAQKVARVAGSPLAYTRLVRANLMHPRALDALHQPRAPDPADPRQLTLAFSFS